MRIKNLLTNPLDFRYMLDDLDLASSCSRQILYETPVMHSAREIRDCYSQLEQFYTIFFIDNNFTTTIRKIHRTLSSLRDIRLTLKRLENGVILDEIELFEIKNLIITNEEIREIFNGIPALADVFILKPLNYLLLLLDPDEIGTNSFYIYDSYSKELSGIRSLLKKSPHSPELFYSASVIEQKIREELSQKLASSSSELNFSLRTLASLDIVIAKAGQMKRLGLSIPKVSKEKTSYSSLFNPMIKEILQKEGKRYQKTNIEFKAGRPLLITGANMGGKSVTLRNVGLCQYLFQCGFAIPAEQAYISPVSDVLLSIGDMQDIYRGLSSFAAEMEQISSILKAAKSGRRLLVLIDEPARSTNPLEGTALVKALISILNKTNISVLVTTHYNIGGKVDCKKIRVRGFEHGEMNYAFVEEEEGVAPHEAINTARSLGIDNQWLDLAESILINDNNES
ncbi:MAG: hypothetical protein PHT63_07815 [Bacteroidales bacterium]|nr:hypothetical protein [Bacteroidales bacterium]